MNVHLIRACPYFCPEDVWLIDFTQAGFAALTDLGYGLCESCQAVVTSPPMLKPNGDDDGRRMWHIHCLLRQNLRLSLVSSGYERVVKEGFNERWRGPSGTVTVEWNRNWRAGTPAV